jgi:hypothetical protein
MNKAEGADLKEEFVRLLNELRHRIAALPEQWLKPSEEEAQRLTKQDGKEGNNQ